MSKEKNILEFARNEFVKLVVISDLDKETVMTLFADCHKAEAKYVERHPQMGEEIWKEYASFPAFTCAIYDVVSDNFVGVCSISDLTQDEYRIMVDIDPRWRKMGYGSSATVLFMEGISKEYGKKPYRARVEITNFVSQQMMNKIGAKLNGVSEYLLHGKALEEFQDENHDMINDDIKNVAAVFGVEPEKLLGIVLEYRIE